MSALGESTWAAGRAGSAPAGAPSPAPALPVDRLRASSQGRIPASFVVDVPAATVAKMRAVGAVSQRQAGAALAAAFAVLLQRYTSDAAFQIGARDGGPVYDVDLTGDPTYATVLARLHRADAEHRRHEPGVAFDVRSADDIRSGDAGEAFGDLALTAFAGEQRLRLQWWFDATLFERATIERMAAQYVYLLTAALAQPATPVSRLPLMDDAERARVLAFGRGESRPYERDATIDALFARQAARTPDALAVVGEGGGLTYAELDARSNRLANYLRSAGATTGASVGIALERSIDLPVGLLGILKAGAAYVPIDLNYPAGRVSFMVDDADITLVVADAAARSRLAACGAHVVALDADGPAIDAHDANAPAIERSADAPAYVMYTSGSTGRAKGVAVPHRGPVRLVRNTDFLAFAPDDVVLQLSPVAFDASTLEIWGALLNGARLAIPRPGLFSADEIGAMIASFGVTTLWLTTSLFARAVESGAPQFGRLRRMVTGGDVVAPDYARRFIAAYPGCRLINGYGPTENTTFSTTYAVPSVDAADARVPIGRPIANSTAYVLDGHLEPVPIGVPGELCVGGDGIAHGYVGLAELTAERFVRDPFADDAGTRFFRSGDRVRWRPDGRLEFLGRTDNQVKIRGFRIELGEIESSLHTCDDVRDAVVVVAPQATEKLLVAFVVPAAGAHTDERRLRSFLADRLPGFMIPHRFVLLAALPEHASGKVDRVALVASAQTVVHAPAPVEPKRVAAATPERTIGEIWREVLGLDAVPDGDQNFFDLGGDSLRLMRIHGLLNERLGTAIGIMDLFEHTTIRKLAAHVRRRRTP